MNCPRTHAASLGLPSTRTAVIFTGERLIQSVGHSMRKGDPALAAKSTTWTTKNAPWVQPVLRSVAGAGSATLPDRGASPPASDAGINRQTGSRITNEGSLSAQMRGFAVPAGDFNAGWMSRQPAVSKSWKP